MHLNSAEGVEDFIFNLDVELSDEMKEFFGVEDK